MKTKEKGKYWKMRKPAFGKGQKLISEVRV